MIAPSLPGAGRPIWVVRCGADGEAEDLFLSDSVVALDWADVPSVEGRSSQAEVREVVANAMPRAKDKTVTAAITQLRKFLGIELGDLVLVPWKSRPTIAVGIVRGPYAYQRGFAAYEQSHGIAWGSSFGHRRRVSFQPHEILRADLTPEAETHLKHPQAFFRAKEHLSVFVPHYEALTPRHLAQARIYAGSLVEHEGHWETLCRCGWMSLPMASADQSRSAYNKHGCTDESGLVLIPKEPPGRQDN